MPYQGEWGTGGNADQAGKVGPTGLGREKGLWGPARGLSLSLSRELSGLTSSAFPPGPELRPKTPSL